MALYRGSGNVNIGSSGSSSSSRGLLTAFDAGAGVVSLDGFDSPSCESSEHVSPVTSHVQFQGEPYLLPFRVAVSIIILLILILRLWSTVLGLRHWFLLCRSAFPLRLLEHHRHPSAISCDLVAIQVVMEYTLQRLLVRVFVRHTAKENSDVLGCPVGHCTSGAERGSVCC